MADRAKGWNEGWMAALKGVSVSKAGKAACGVNLSTFAVIKTVKALVWGWRDGRERGVCGSDGADAMSYIVVDSA